MLLATAWIQSIRFRPLISTLLISRPPNPLLYYKLKAMALITMQTYDHIYTVLFYLEGSYICLLVTL
jgi:hypothetical protein